MRLPQIRVNSDFARIEIKTSNARLSIEQPKAELEIEQPKAEMEIERIPAKLSIDQTKAWEDMDLKHIFKRIEEAAQNGYSDWINGLARRAQQGNELMKIENNGNTLAAQVKENSTKPEHQFNIGWIPSLFSVKIDYVPAEVKTQVKPQKAIINATTKNPIIDVNNGIVETSLKQLSSLEVDFINLKFKGVNYEQEI
jgi:hypothetical protein